jgi:chromosome segregation ATPase
MNESLELLRRVEARLEEIDNKLDRVTQSRHKSLEWMATLSEHVQSLDAFREEVRASFEPLLAKLQDIDEVMRIMRHATADVARRVTEIEQRRMAG